jgi:hypothetical protein
VIFAPRRLSLPRRFVLRVGLSVTPRRKREGIADFWTLRPPLSPA